MGVALVTVGELSAYLRRSLSGDALAPIAISAASDLVRSYLGQRLDYELDETITLNGSGTDALLLPDVPVEDVLTVTVNGTEVTDWVLGDPEAGILYRTTAGLVGAVWPRGRQNIEVVYTHGYYSAGPFGSGSGSGWPLTDIPDDVKMVALEVAARIWDQGLVRQETMAGYQVSYSTSAGHGLTPTEAAVLDRHKVDRMR